MLVTFWITFYLLVENQSRPNKTECSLYCPKMTQKRMKMKIPPHHLLFISFHSFTIFDSSTEEYFIQVFSWVATLLA